MQISKKKMPYGYAVGYIVDGKTAGKGNAHGLFAVGVGQNTHSATLFPPSREAMPSAKAAHKRSSGSGDKMLMCAFETG